MSEVAQARDEVARAYRELGRLGLNFGSAGNVSCRVTEGMVITRSGTTVDATAEGDTVWMTLDGNATDAAVPSSEWPMHAAILRSFPEAGSVVHTHADACTALACLGERLPAFHYMVAGFGGDDVRCAPYVTFGTPELAEVAVEAMRERTACLLGNHGMIVTGRDVKTALAAAVRLETLARQYLLARSAGTPRLLDAGQMDATRERYKTYGGAASTQV
ncbi:class II aldolase [Roseomonas sp. KE2513]|uniref:class II aldolase/adducin family protein n=1 Tax=Roseomonas sp. KE2513 TaxID=2479202 RepID=UPI0018DF5CAB|nr:class II aldolase/adducin family protein [Roseomonas sp. KE2513]MBI0538160.1 class II aldolase [Roseomonas sp. KE2513]